MVWKKKFQLVKCKICTWQKSFLLCLLILQNSFLMISRLWIADAVCKSKQTWLFSLRSYRLTFLIGFILWHLLEYQLFCYFYLMFQQQNVREKNMYNLSIKYKRQIRLYSLYVCSLYYKYSRFKLNNNSISKFWSELIISKFNVLQKNPLSSHNFL